MEPTRSVSVLFETFSLLGLALRNRVVMAPMTRRFSPGGVPGANVAAYYGRRAAGGVGLIITEGTYIDHPTSGPETGVPRLARSESATGWREVTRTVHAENGRIFLQLWHVGLSQVHHIRSVPAPAGSIDPSVPLIGPSGLDGDGNKVSEPMTDRQIASVIEAFGRTAALAKAVGFDGIELHGAHGYLLDQFMWKRTNRRADRYGGDIAERTRFAVEVIKECRRAIGPEMPISYRLSQWKVADYCAKLANDPAELEKLLAPLTEAGVNVFHCSTRRFWEPEFSDSQLNLAGWVKKISGLPTITVGSVGLDSVFTDRGTTARPDSIDGLIERMARDEFDLVAVGRLLISNPSWPNIIREGRQSAILPFTRSLADQTLW